MVNLEFHDSVVVDANPDVLYEIVSDVTRIGDFSPQCRACWWDDGDGPTVGAHFSGRNEADGQTWESRNEVVAAEPGREFAWITNDGWVRWGFVIEPVDGGTRLTETWNFLPPGTAGFHHMWGDDADNQIARFSRFAKEGIPATLAAIKRVAQKE